MMFRRILIANRGEIAVRIARAAAELGAECVAVFSADEVDASHLSAATFRRGLPARGPSAYLDMGAVLDIARAAGCDAVHPGYGFLSESAAFAATARDAGIAFIGPCANTLEVWGDKLAARTLAREIGIPVPLGTSGATDLATAIAFFDSLGPRAAVMVKAVHGGGGRGMRPVLARGDLEAAFDLCAAEATAAFGDGALYVEQLVPRARHVEVQIAGDHTGAVVALGARDCSLQRRRQKLLEIAPPPFMAANQLSFLEACALRLARRAACDNLATAEFLVDLDATDPEEGIVFLEANPRLQVEHTVTEEVLGVDLVQAQIRLAAGECLDDLSLAPAPPSRGYALQLRLSAERWSAEGKLRPSSGTVARLDLPGGPGIRLDTALRVGGEVSSSFDPLLAKLVVSAPTWPEVVARARRALSEFRLEGVFTNSDLMMALLARRELLAGPVDTLFFERVAADLAAEAGELDAGEPAEGALDGNRLVAAPLSGMLVAWQVSEGDLVHAGASLCLLEAMKMQHAVEAPSAGRVISISAAEGAGVGEGQALLVLAPLADDAPTPAERGQRSATPRTELADLARRLSRTEDAARPEAVGRRHAQGRRTAREILGSLFDGGSFHEYGALVIAAQRARRSLEDLRNATPADGIITAIGRINGAEFVGRSAECMALAYDYTVMAGTQGYLGHRKTDRAIAVAARLELPIILFAEGGGGRPGDVDAVVASGLDTTTFRAFAGLDASSPRIGIAAGRCFAGNAVLFGCCDLRIGQAGASIGLGGPAMIEGGGLGVVAADAVGPAEVHARNGTLDVVVPDDEAAADMARRLLGYFQGRAPSWRMADQSTLRDLVPADRRRAYDMGRLVEVLFDAGSTVVLGSVFGGAVLTAFARLEGWPLGVIANDPRRNGGAIDADAAAKTARFLRLCGRFGLPVVSLCDTPGFMVGPASEQAGALKHGADLFAAAAQSPVPILTVVVRRAYGLGAQAMAGGGLHEGPLTVSWPTGEFGGMGLEGSVRLAYGRELDAIGDPDARKDAFQARVDELYERGRALSVAEFGEIDAVIDPSDTRAWLARLLGLASAARYGRKQPRLDGTAGSGEVGAERDRGAGHDA